MQQAFLEPVLLGTILKLGCHGEQDRQRSLLLGSIQLMDTDNK